MKTPIFPVICGFALTAMTAAVASHWWSLHQFSLVLNSELPTSLRNHFAAATPAAQPMPIAARENRAASTAAAPIPSQKPHQKEFYEALISKMNSLQTQNRDLLDQLAETNRDLMKLEFRVDTHSESFRPLPITEERIDTSFEDSFEESPGVLPPRAEPVFLPTQE